NNSGATSLMWAVPDVATMRVLVDAGADVNARSDEGASALVIASGIVGAAPAVTLLLDYGADLWVSRGGGAPLREAARADDIATFRLLWEYGARLTDAGAPTAQFVRMRCHRCAELIGAGDPLPLVPVEFGAAKTAPVYDPGRSAHPTPVGPTPA